MAWHERILALEAQVRVTLLDVEGELSMRPGAAGAPHQGTQGGLALGCTRGFFRISGWGELVPDACGLPDPAEGFGLVQL